MKKNNRVFMFLLLIGLGDVVFAENDQTVVVGLGSGIHNFSQTDELRNSFLDINYAGASDLYLEWYLFEEIGLGVRLNSLGVQESLVGLSSSIEREFSINNKFITVNWVPVGGTSYTRFGLLAGLGRSTYEYDERVDGVTVYSKSSDGPAVLFGGYVDWGAEDFGARFSLKKMNTNLGTIEGSQVDASGISWGFDLRWAFK